MSKNRLPLNEQILFFAWSFVRKITELHLMPAATLFHLYRRFFSAQDNPEASAVPVFVYLSEKKQVETSPHVLLR